MLGEQIGEETGQTTGMRVLPDEGHGAKVEVSFQQTGTLLGAHVNDMGPAGFEPPGLFVPKPIHGVVCQG